MVLQEVSSSWPPIPPDMTVEAFRKDSEPGAFPEYQRIALSKSHKYIYKVSLSTNEYRLHQAAGPCAVDIIGRVLTLKDPRIPDDAQPNDRAQQGKALVWMIIMPLERVLDYRQKFDASKRLSIVQELIQVVKTLHSKYGVIHGDIKPQNFLHCHDGSIRLCDFGEARFISDDPDKWEGLVTEETATPYRYLHPDEAPTIDDDWYSLGITIWTLYSGRDPLCPIEQIGKEIKRVPPIDIELITDASIKEEVRKYLALGGVEFGPSPSPGSSARKPLR